MAGLKHWGLAALTTGFMAPYAHAQVAQPGAPALSTETEVEAVSSWFVGAGGRVVPFTGGEALQGMGLGLGGSAHAGLVLDERISLRVTVGWTSHKDDLASERAEVVDIMLDLAWTWGEGPLRAAIGPILGYSWLDRGIYTHRNGGLVAGAALRIRHPMRDGLDLVASASSRWTSYPSPPLLPPAPEDPDGRAMAAQLGIAVGVSWRVDLRDQEGGSTGRVAR